MGCVFRPAVNSIWSIWYCILTAALNAYLIYLGIERYRLYAELHWPAGTPAHHIAAYVGLHAAAIGALPAFIACALFRLGNLAGDNERLGARARRTVRVNAGGETGTGGGAGTGAGGGGGCWCARRAVKAVWAHLPPVSHTVHLAMAFCLLLAQQLMLAQLFRQKFMSTGDLFSTEMDFVFESGKRLGQNIPTNATFQGFQSSNKFELTRKTIGPKLLPILMNQTLFGVSLEFVNFVMALLFFSISYAAVFQRASTWFTFIFSCHLITYTADAIFSYFAFSLNVAFVLPNDMSVLIIYIICAFVLYLASTIVYGYGYNKFQTSWLALRTRNPVTIGAPADSRRNDSPSKRKPDVMTTSQVGGTDAGSVCCAGYLPQVCAFLFLIPLVALKAPILHDLIMMYPEKSNPIVLACIVVDIIYLVSWVLLWLALTCKGDWTFKTAYTVPEIVALLQADRPPSGKRTADDSRLLNDLDDAMLLLAGNEVMIIVDKTARNSIFYQARKCGEEPSMEADVYWLRSGTIGTAATMNLETVSPATNRRFVGDNASSEVQRPLLEQTIRQRKPTAEHAAHEYDAYQTIGSPKRHHSQQDARMRDSFIRCDESGDRQTLQQENVVFAPSPEPEDSRQHVTQGNTADIGVNELHPPPPAQQRYPQVQPGSSSVDGFYASIHKQQQPPSSVSGTFNAIYQQHGTTTGNYTRYAQPPPGHASMSSEGPSNMYQPSDYYHIPQPSRQPPLTKIVPLTSNVTSRQSDYPYGTTCTPAGPSVIHHQSRYNQNTPQLQYQIPPTSSDAHNRGNGVTMKMTPFDAIAETRPLSGVINEDSDVTPTFAGGGQGENQFSQHNPSSSATRVDRAGNVWHSNPMHAACDMDATSSSTADNCTPSSTLTSSQNSYVVNMTPPSDSPHTTVIDNYGTLTPLKTSAGGGVTTGGLLGTTPQRVMPAGAFNYTAHQLPSGPQQRHSHADSANFSLTSSNESAPPAPGDTQNAAAANDHLFSTSIV